MLDLPNRFRFEGQEIRWGTIGDGPPLVAVHGTPFSSQVWRRIAPAVAGRYRVYYYDLLGYGLSEKRPGQDVSLGVQNRVLTALVGEWGLTDPAILCHDFGGATVLRAHYLDGLRMSALTIIDPVAVAPWGSPLVRHVRQHVAAFEGLPPYLHEALLRAYLQTASYRGLDDEAVATYMEPWLGEVGQAAFYRQIAQMEQKYTDEVENLYGAMDCPVRILWGEEDDWIPIERGRAFAARLGGTPLVPVPGCGHLVQEDGPEAIVAAVLGHLP